jgi:hypothetical protein
MERFHANKESPIPNEELVRKQCLGTKVETCSDTILPLAVLY